MKSTPLNLNPAFEANDSHEAVWLTPEEAVMLLERNTRNRPVRPAHVAKLKSDMREGRWQYNGEPLKFSHDLVLLDGQHRLIALSEMPAGTRIKFLIVYGLAQQSQSTMDQGTMRGAFDTLVLDDMIGGSVQHAKYIAAAARSFIPWENGTLFTTRGGRTQITNTAVVEWVADHPEHVKVIDYLCSQNGVVRIKGRTGMVLAILTHLHMIDPAVAEQFTTKIVSGANMTDRDPVLALSKRLERARDEGKKPTDRELIYMFVSAWNAFRRGRPLSKIQLPSGGVTADNLPEAI